MTALAWGHRYLMCPPDHFDVAYEINPWMHREIRPDREQAHTQWMELNQVMRRAGAQIDTLKPAPDAPDLVFTANAGVVSGSRYVSSNFKFEERRPETPVNRAWFERRGFDVVGLPPELCHEGAGDALPFGGVLLSGYRWRSDARAGAVLADLLAVPVRTVELTDQRLYHFDLTFCPLDDRRAICAAQAWDDYGRTVIEGLVPEPLWLEDDEALAFTANSIVIDQTVIMPTCPPRVGRILEGWGFDPVVVDVGEFIKAGGGVRCLTLALDVEIGAG